MQTALPKHLCTPAALFDISLLSHFPLWLRKPQREFLSFALSSPHLFPFMSLLIAASAYLSRLKVLKGHDDHVITCLQFCGNRIVSGSDDNTLKVWSAITGKVKTGMRLIWVTCCSVTKIIKGCRRVHIRCLFSTLDRWLVLAFKFISEERYAAVLKPSQRGSLKFLIIWRKSCCIPLLCADMEPFALRSAFSAHIVECIRSFVEVSDAVRALQKKSCLYRFHQPVGWSLCAKWQWVLCHRTCWQTFKMSPWDQS